MTQISLISEQWIPVRDRKGVVRKISPLEILDEEIVDIAAERADFQTALWQFLIGLIQTTLAPEDEDAWFDIWEEGLEKADLAKAFSKVGPAFIFGPQSPSFMQDFDQLEGEAVPLAALLPESPGENTIKHNKDQADRTDRLRYSIIIKHNPKDPIFPKQHAKPDKDQKGWHSQPGGHASHQDTDHDHNANKQDNLIQRSTPFVSQIRHARFRFRTPVTP